MITVILSDPARSRRGVEGSVLPGEFSSAFGDKEADSSTSLRSAQNDSGKHCITVLSFLLNPGRFREGQDPPLQYSTFLWRHP